MDKLPAELQALRSSHPTASSSIPPRPAPSHRVQLHPTAPSSIPPRPAPMALPPRPVQMAFPPESCLAGPCLADLAVAVYPADEQGSR
ncbi:hypothetical protein E2P81_ATG00076 [Venturia nashicola]|uniref:Uncharacterized protein n=1 Tax=Venturia nashicola TaxID=86259 RepID=A0A4Z1PFF9_9PEZI|nr:hypothetical protein E6O75_ATG00083 [Venturia nashicola]TLD39089.1 hypothetical protein E2P81_ATG00076 [Venturia nashicola]